MNAHPAPLAATQEEGPPMRTRAAGLVRRWPAAAGLAVAALVIVTGLADTYTLAVTASAAALCYLAAAAFGRRWMAWPAIIGASAVIVLGELLGIPWWAALSFAGVLLVVVGVARGASRRQLTAQAVGFAAFTAVGVVALAVDPRAGLLLAGFALASHSVWDLVHHRRDDVVSRSLAEACMWLDAPLALGFIVLSLVL